MRSIFLTFIFITTIGLISCEDSFSPKVIEEENYVVSCIIGIADTHENFRPTAYLTKIYDVAGIDPTENELDPTISGAIITLGYSHGETHFLDEDTLIYYDPLNPDSILWVSENLYGNPFILYKANEIRIQNQEMSLEINLMAGKKLTANTKFPRGVFFNYSYDFPHGVTPEINQWKHGDYWGIYWDTLEEELYFVTLILSYSIEDDSTTKYHEVEMPLQYIKRKGNQEPVYPKYQSTGKLEYKFNAIDKTLSLISDGDTKKSKYKIWGLEIRAVVYSKELAKYYSSTNGYLDPYSVRLDEKVYSNINGGLGIFGTYKSTSIPHEIDEDYIHSFGYKSRYDN
ncbi:hypothetical protein ACFLS9_02670 [Bacteroidota bacterium]